MSCRFILYILCFNIIVTVKKGVPLDLYYIFLCIVFVMSTMNISWGVKAGA